MHKFAIEGKTYEAPSRFNELTISQWSRFSTVKSSTAIDYDHFSFVGSIVGVSKNDLGKLRYNPDYIRLLTACKAAVVLPPEIGLTRNFTVGGVTYVCEKAFGGMSVAQLNDYEQFVEGVNKSGSDVNERLAEFMAILYTPNGVHYCDCVFDFDDRVVAFGAAPLHAALGALNFLLRVEKILRPNIQIYLQNMMSRFQLAFTSHLSTPPTGGVGSTESPTLPIASRAR